MQPYQKLNNEQEQIKQENSSQSGLLSTYVHKAGHQYRFSRSTVLHSDIHARTHTQARSKKITYSNCAKKSLWLSKQFEIERGKRRGTKTLSMTDTVIQSLIYTTSARYRTRPNVQ